MIWVFFSYTEAFLLIVKINMAAYVSCLYLYAKVVVSGNHFLNNFWSFCSNDNFVSSISYPKVFGYLIPTLVSVVSVNVQGTTKPLMETHRVSLCVSLVAIIVHYVAFAADNISRRRQANSSQLWGLIAIIFGSLSAVSLVSTFFTQIIAEIICYIALSSSAIIMVVYQYGRKFMDACHWLYHRILKPFFCRILNWFQAHYNNVSSPKQQQRPGV